MTRRRYHLTRAAFVAFYLGLALGGAFFTTLEGGTQAVVILLVFHHFGGRTVDMLAAFRRSHGATVHTTPTHHTPTERGDDRYF